MSKHEKQVRRERMKTERGRRWRSWGLKPQATSLKPGAAAIAAAATIAAGTSVYASPVRFDNPPGEGHFVWTALAGQDVLDIMSDSGSQPGILGAIGTFEVSSYYGRIVVGGASTGLQFMRLSGYHFLAGVGSGEAIPTSSFDDFGVGYIYSTYPNAPTTSLLPEGNATYLGIRFDQGEGYQYGWIGVVRTGMELDAFAWGYETEPGVAIPAGAVPEPGTLAMLALGALGVTRRRR